MGTVVGGVVVDLWLAECVASGFGWHEGKHPLYNWHTLSSGLVNCFMSDYTPREAIGNEILFKEREIKAFRLIQTIRFAKVRVTLSLVQI